MNHSAYRWVIVAAGSLLGCVAVGGMFALPVFLRPIADDTGWSVAGISGAMTLGFLAMAFGSMAWGALSDRIGPRPVVLIGSALLSASLALTALSTSLIQFQLIFGLAVGAATAAIFAPMMACVTLWFETQRALAVSLVSAGMGVAPMTMSPLAAWLVSNHDWRSALLVVAAICALLMIPAAMLIRRPPQFSADGGSPALEQAAAKAPGGDSGTVDVLRSAPFVVLLLTNFFCCATHSGPIFHTVSYAVTCGIPLIAAVSIYSVEGLAGLGGRIAFGLMGDRFGAKRVLIVGLLAQGIGALAYVFVSQLAAFYAVASIFGFIYGGIMPLYAVLARDAFPARLMGTVIGGTAMAGSLGMALGPSVGGWIYDSFASYQGLYVAAFGMGIAATFMAFFFPTAKRPAIA
jgi:MFS family permease